MSDFIDESDVPATAESGEDWQVPTWVVAGPTAGGKSQLSRAISERFETPVISMDSMKVYRGMDIGTAKPRGELADQYRLIDIRDPWERFWVGEFLDEALRLQPSTGPALISGGTGLYLNVLLQGIFRGPPPDLELRASLEDEARSFGIGSLHARMARLDPASGESIQASDRRRIIRALEVMAHHDEPFSQLKARRVPVLKPGRFRLIGIARPRAELYERINDRCCRMFDEGWVAEVERLREAHDPAWSEQANQSIGYSQILDALEKGEDPRERLEFIQTRTRHFARHQLIWFRKMPIEWWRPDEQEELIDRMQADLSGFRQTGHFPEPDPARAAPEFL